MDGDPVGEGPTDNANGGDDGKPDVAPMSLAEMFTNLCPAYMAMGMSYKEFWHCNTKVHRAYRKAWEQRKAYRNWEMWWQGGYLYEALVKAAPLMRTFGKGRIEAGKYSEEPYPLTQKEADERLAEQHRQKIKQMLAIFEKESAENAKKRKLEAKED